MIAPTLNDLLVVRILSWPTCKICAAETVAFDVVDLMKSCNGQPASLSGRPVFYVICIRCQFVFTTYFDDFTPEQWLDIIYNDEYYRTIDPDYADVRPHWNALQVDTMLPTDTSALFGIDYGGGNGRTAAILRERGLTYDSYDPYGVTDMTSGRDKTYNFCSAFEVAEHTTDPRGMIADILRLATPGPLIMLIGTLVHDGEIEDPVRLNWWYAAPRNGHISLFSYRSLEVLAEQFGLSLISFNASQHVFFRGHGATDIRRRMLVGKVRHRVTSMFSGRR